MTRKSWRVATASVAAISLFSLAACGVGGGSKPAADDSDSDSTASAPVEEEITGEITFQTWNLKASFQDYFEELVTSFESEYPGTKVDWIDQPADGYADKLSADAAAGTLPDVVNLDAGTGYALAEAGMLVNLKDVDPDAGDRFLDAAWDANNWPAIGGTFAYPWYLSTGPALFNTALFEKGGLDPEALPSTYDELFDQANTMAKNSGGDFAMLGNTPTIEHFGMYGVELMNEDQTEYTFNSEDGVEFVQRYKDLYDNGGLLPEALSQNYTGVDSNFQTARIAYMPGSAYNIAQIEENAPSVYESLVFTEAIANTAPNMFSQSIAVSANTENEATALAFAQWVTNAENQLRFAKVVSIFPSSAGTLDDPFFDETDGSDDQDVRVLSAKQISKSIIFSPPMFSEASKSELREQMAGALLGQKTVQEALDAAVAYSNDRLNTN